MRNQASVSRARQRLTPLELRPKSPPRLDDPLETSPREQKKAAVLARPFNSFLPKGYRSRAAIERTSSALMEVGGILSDVGYYRKLSLPTMEEVEARSLGLPMSPTMQAEGGLSRGGWYLEMKSPQNLGEVRNLKRLTEGTWTIVEKCTPSLPNLTSLQRHQNRRRRNLIRRVIMSWQMATELHALINWVANMMRSELIAQRVCAFKPPFLRTILRIYFFYKPLRALAQWRNKIFANQRKMAAQEAERNAAAQDALNNKASNVFAMEFLACIDEDGDGGLSLVELKAAEMGKRGSTANPLFAKAAIWLTHGRTFQRYDTRGIGIIEEDKLKEAMEVFLTDMWKYDGVLW